MENQPNKRDTARELAEQAIEYLWVKHQFEDAIILIKRLLRHRPRYPLCYFLLSDCYKGISIRDHDVIANEKAEKYWDKAFAPDGKFVHSDYYEQGIEVAARYLLETQELEACSINEEQKIQELSKKPKITSGELYQAISEQGSVSKDPAVRLKYWELLLSKAKWGYNQTLYSFDSEGKPENPTLQEFKKAKLKDPKRQIVFFITYKDPITEEETQYAFNILKNFNLDSPSESVIKAREYNKDYYKNHREERLKHQRLYDSKNRQRKRARNKLDYSWRRSGLTKKQAFPRDNSDIQESL